jgi:hypothetical protein
MSTESPQLIEATSVAMKTLADGTLRITVEVEPYAALAAFSLFRQPSTVMALAALKQPESDS